MSECLCDRLKFSISVHVQSPDIWCFILFEKIWGAFAFGSTQKAVFWLYIVVLIWRINSLMMYKDALFEQQVPGLYSFCICVNRNSSGKLPQKGKLHSYAIVGNWYKSNDSLYYILSVNEKLPVSEFRYSGKYIIQLDGYFYAYVSGERQTGVWKN